MDYDLSELSKNTACKMLDPMNCMVRNLPFLERFRNPRISKLPNLPVHSPDLIGKLDNFNLSPDIVDSGQALERAEELKSTWDPDPTHQAAQEAKDAAQDAK